MKEGEGDKTAQSTKNMVLLTFKKNIYKTLLFHHPVVRRGTFAHTCVQGKKKIVNSFFLGGGERCDGGLRMRP